MAKNGTATTNTTPHGGADWPGAFAAYKPSKEAVMTNLGTYVGLIALMIVAALIPNFFADKNNEFNPVYLVVQVLSYALSVLFTGAVTYLMIKNVRHQKADLNEALNAGVAKFAQMVVQTILITIIVFMSILLLIVPFFFVLPRVFLAPYYIFDRDMTAVDAIKASWEETRGHSTKVWGIIGVNVLIALIAVTIIGIPLAIYFAVLYSAAETLLYFWLKDRRPVSANTATSGPILSQKA